LNENIFVKDFLQGKRHSCQHPAQVEKLKACSQYFFQIMDQPEKTFHTQKNLACFASMPAMKTRVVIRLTSAREKNRELEEKKILVNIHSLKTAESPFFYIAEVNLITTLIFVSDIEAK
jgi:hypothetical protein